MTVATVVETRLARMAAVVAVPALAAAIALPVVEVYRLVQPDAPLFGGPVPSSLTEAITRGHPVERAYAFIHAGQDPNVPVAVNAPDYTDGQTVMVSPLVLAVAAGQGNTALMLLNFGARLDLPQNRLAPCLAQAIGNQEVIGILTRYGGPAPPVPCPAPRADAPTMLLAWIDTQAMPQR
jgi:hypothetical protein